MKSKRKSARFAARTMLLLMMSALLAGTQYAAAKPARRIRDIYDDAAETEKQTPSDDPVEVTPRYRRIQIEESSDAYMATRSSKVAGAARLTGIRVDGQKERFWDLCEVYTPVNHVYGDGALTASFRAVCDAERLYLLVEVEDDTVNCAGEIPTRKDGVEIFLNESGRRPEQYEEGDCHYILLRDGTLVCGNGASGERVEAAVTPTEKGYRMELAIDWVLAPNRRSNDIGLDVRINDSRAPGTRDAILAWSDTSLLTHRDLRRVGILSLR